MPQLDAKQARLEQLLATLGQLGFEQREETLRLTLPQPVVFPFDSDVPSAASRESLTRIGLELSVLGVDRVFVYGHTDSKGPAEYNQALSLRRANVIAQILIDSGFPADRIERKGFGASVTTASNATAAGRAKNRRVVIVVQVD